MTAITTHPQVLLLGSLVMLAGVAKVLPTPRVAYSRHLKGRTAFMQLLSSHPAFRRVAWPALIVLELAVGISLFLAYPATWPLALSTLYFAAALLFLRMAQVRFPGAKCGCFGVGHRISTRAYVRPGAFCAISLFICVVPSALRSPYGTDRWTVWPLLGGELLALAVGSRLPGSWARYRHGFNLLKGNPSYGLSPNEIWTRCWDSGVCARVRPSLAKALGYAMLYPSRYDTWHHHAWSFLALQVPVDARSVTLVIAVNHRTIPAIVRATTLQENTGERIGLWASYSESPDLVSPSGQAHLPAALT
jgi:hypothetical protein